MEGTLASWQASLQGIHHLISLISISQSSVRISSSFSPTLFFPPYASRVPRLGPFFPRRLPVAVALVRRAERGNKQPRHGTGRRP